MRLPGCARKKSAYHHRRLLIVWPGNCQTIIAQHTGDDLDLGDSMRVTQDDTDLGRRGALLGEFANLVNDLVGSGLHPRRGVAAVGNGRSRNSLSVGVKTTHFG